VKKKLLFISNGHGEDAEASHIARALRESGLPVEMEAIAIVGEGRAYRNAGVPIVGPTFTPVSGGFTYMDRRLLLDDIRAGLIGAAIGQLRAVRKRAAACDLVVATGDEYGQLFAYASKRPFISFIAPLSANYTDTLKLDLILRWIIRSRRCLSVVTRDQLTARDLTAQGYPKVVYGGNPSVDFLAPSGADLSLAPGDTVIGLLPGSRVPEAERNFLLQMRFVVEVAKRLAETGDTRRLAFRAALVPSVMDAVPRLAEQAGWQLEGRLLKYRADGIETEIGVHADAFPDILQAATLVVAMAGQASDQALALGKPSFMFAGGGPQFTWRFAEAQYRYHGGLSVLVGDGPADDATLREAAIRLLAMLDDRAYLDKVAELGPQRVGSLGSAGRFVDIIARHLGFGSDDLPERRG